MKRGCGPPQESDSVSPHNAIPWDGHLVSESTPSRPGPCKGSTPQPPLFPTKIPTFSYHRITTVNAMKFTHQSLCNPPIVSLIKAINASFLKQAPHLTAKAVQKYLVPNPNTSKSHMKRPCKGLRSTSPKPTPLIAVSSLLHLPYAPSIHQNILPGLIPTADDDESRPAFSIDDIDDESIHCKRLLFWRLCQQTPAARGLEELYVQNLHCFVFQTDGQTDRQTETLILIPTFKIYVFLYSVQTDKWTEGQRN
jgi:hypothetical protein